VVCLLSLWVAVELSLALEAGGFFSADGSHTFLDADTFVMSQAFLDAGIPRAGGRVASFFVVPVADCFFSGAFVDSVLGWGEFFSSLSYAKEHDSDVSASEEPGMMLLFSSPLEPEEDGALELASTDGSRGDSGFDFILGTAGLLVRDPCCWLLLLLLLLRRSLLLLNRLRPRSLLLLLLHR